MGTPRRHSRMLINEPPLLVLPSLAAAIGLYEAIILQQVHYWLEQSGHERDGRKWIYNSYREWQSKQFPFLTVNQVRRAIEHLEGRGLLIAGDYNKRSFDKTKWYTINYDALDALPLTEYAAPSGKSALPSGMGAKWSGTGALPSGMGAKPIPETTTETTTERETGALGIAGTFVDGKLYTALSDMSDTATGDMRTGDIPRNSLPCAEPVEVTVKVDPFDSLPSARPGIVNGRPVRGAAPAAPPATKHPAFAPTVAAIKAGYPARDGAGPTDKEIRRALALVDPAQYGAIVAALPVYSRCKDVREGVICSIGRWLEDERWTVYQPKAAPVVRQAPSAVNEIARRRAARAQKEQ